LALLPKEPADSIFHDGAVSLSSTYALCFRGFFTMIWHPALTRMRAFRISAICVLVFLLAAIAGRAQAADLWVGGYALPVEVEAFCAACIRDAIYADTKLIADLEANPDVDEAFKGPIVLGARADVHRLRKTLGPGERISAAPCCYFRKPLYVR
jgi:hypothetical protein